MGTTPGGSLAALRRLGATALGLLLAVVAGVWLLGSLIEHDPAWPLSQNQRERILWDSEFDGSPVILIGGSEFISGYVDSPRETLWARLAARSGLRVFPAALTGADPQDMLLVARRVAALWPPGTTAFIGIIPTRIFFPVTTFLPTRSRYGAQFRRLVDLPDPSDGWLERVDRRLVFELSQRSFLIRNQEFLLPYLEARLRRRPMPFRDAFFRNRVWNVEGDSALSGFRRLEAVLAASGVDHTVPFRWVRALDEVLTRRGIRPVFVLTPLNSTLISQYSDGRVPAEPILTASHDYLVRALLASGYEFVDLFRSLGSSSFADVLHTNSRGDDEMALALSDWLRGHAPVDRPGGRGLGAPASQPVR